jgi:hypothetical protein
MKRYWRVMPVKRQFAQGHRVLSQWARKLPRVLINRMGGHIGPPLPGFRKEDAMALLLSAK